MKWIRLFILCAIVSFGLPTVFAADPIASGKPSSGEGPTKTDVAKSGTAQEHIKKPLDMLNIYLDAFHFHSGSLKEQMEVHHYCGHLNEDFVQCVLYDGNTPDARLIGVEYVISEKLFKSLPREEKRMWHSHAYEVTSGQLILPDLAEPAEHGIMEKLVSTYGKTWHTWNTEMPGNKLPVGTPSLMMAFTADGQLNPELLARRDKAFGISTEAKKKSRVDIQAPPIQPGADAWQQGESVQLRLKTMAIKGRKAPPKATKKQKASTKQL